MPLGEVLERVQNGEGDVPREDDAALVREDLMIM
jgi:hypothetical protein